MNTALSQWRQTLRSHAEFAAWHAANGAVLDDQWRPTIALQAALRDAKASASVPSRCIIPLVNTCPSMVPPSST